MSFLYGTNVETIYSMPASGASSAPPGAASVILSGNTASNPACLLPPLNNIWPMANIAGKALRIVARGIWGTPASSPGTWIIGCGLNTTQATKPATIVLAATGAFTPTATLAGLSVSNGEWELEFDVVIQTSGTAAGATPVANVIAGGTLTMGTGNNAAVAAATAFGIGSAAAINVNPTQAYYLEVYATFSTGPASTQIQCNQLLVLGLN